MQNHTLDLYRLLHGAVSEFFLNHIVEDFQTFSIFYCKCLFSLTLLRKLVETLLLEETSNRTGRERGGEGKRERARRG